MILASDRPERLDYIDGLRAVAVALVVYFHAQLPGLPNGYFGVDVFFVISGFVITSQINDAVHRGSFSMVEFYARRILRIWPPLLLVILTVLIALASVPLLPADIRRIALSAIASSAMVSNWYFMQETADYFAFPAMREPLLHIWSLGVEEQYYIVAPAFILALAAIAKRYAVSFHRLALIAAIAVILPSLGLAIAFAQSKPHLVFYGTPWRVWEFAVGSAATLAIGCGLTLKPKVAGIGLLCGLAAIALACVVPEEAKHRALLLQGVAVLGTGAVLLCGNFARQSAAARLLSWRPVVGLGLVSYSFYLWHWPLLTFWRLLHLAPTSPFVNAIFGILVPLLLAILTWFALERPLTAWRHSGQLKHRSWRAIAQGTAAATLICATGIGLTVWSDRLNATDRFSAYADAQKTFIVTECPSTDRQNSPMAECRTSPAVGSTNVRVLLWGDSHAGSLWTAVSRIAGETGRVAQLQWDPVCAPLPHTELYFLGTMHIKCMRANDTVLGWLTSGELSGVTGVIFEARWFVSQQMFSAEAPSDPARLGQAIGLAIRRLNAMGLRVLVIGPVPDIPFPGPECAFRAELAGDPGRCNARRNEVDSLLGAIADSLRSAVRSSDNARFVDVRAALCDSEVCRSTQNGQIFYTDDNHLSNAGALFVLDKFREDFEWVFGASHREVRLSQ